MSDDALWKIADQLERLADMFEQQYPTVVTHEYEESEDALMRHAELVSPSINEAVARKAKEMKAAIEDEPGQVLLTQDDVIKALLKLGNKGAKSVLAEFKVKKVQALKPSDYADVIEVAKGWKDESEES